MERYQEKLRGTLLPPWEQLPDFGLYMDQLITFADRCFAWMSEPGQRTATPSMINNYVKGGLVDRPQGKKYSRDSLAQLLMLCLLKSTTSMETLKRLLHPTPETDTHALYEAFRAAQGRIADALTIPADPMTCALAASSYQSLCKAMLDDTTADT